MKVNKRMLQELERSLDTFNPEGGKIPIKILGYGEISLVFELLNDSEPVAYKRIPIFDTEKQVKRHIWAYNEYNKLLAQAGLRMPQYDTVWFKDDMNRIQFYCVQEKIHPDSVGHKIIHKLNPSEIRLLVLLAMREMKKVWGFNKENPVFDLALDGQISNFALIDYNPHKPSITPKSKLYYLDTSTPLFRINGQEAMNAVLLLKSAPSFLRGILKALFLQDTVDRYYDWRRVSIDLIANFYKEQRPELIPSLTRLVNKFFQEEAEEFDIEPISLEEIKNYYKSDAQMWTIFQAVRRFDRFLKERVFKKQYNFYLPGKIQR
ncbi:MAG: hypothetical protein GF383_00580 [Candidatus Lokiarchaeota archaeon]|nr:hypothetical protein [Candidatus Lokiarchaeota archaeon]MBD3337662.1 hypothetical protein [Candidatus Lokiarchaeota archaeon]